MQRLFDDDNLYLLALRLRTEKDYRNSTKTEAMEMHLHTVQKTNSMSNGSDGGMRRSNAQREFISEMGYA